MSFIDQIIARAKENPKCIVLPESDDERTIHAAERILAEKIAKVILMGKEDEVKSVVPGANLEGAIFVDPATDADYEQYCEQFYEMRKAKGMTAEKARSVLLDFTHYGMMMVKNKRADGLVSGAVHSSSDTIRPALQILKTKPGTKLVSAFFMMVVPDCKYGENGLFLYADSGLNENPNAEQVSEIALSSAESFRALTGKEPRIAMCCYSSHGSAHSELTEKMVEATRLAKEKAPDLKLDGELQIDAAFRPEIAKRKAPNSVIQGDANVLIFPDLNAGNIAYKLTQYLAKAEAYGPLLQGIAYPVNDLSRGCSANDIVGVVAITAVQATLAD